VTFVLFSVAHYSGGGLALALVAAWGGFVLTVLYLWRRNLWTTILAHWLTDAFGLLLAPMMNAHH
jgi:membrane protease YdiL (CAAX protease family)